MTSEPSPLLARRGLMLALAGALGLASAGVARAAAPSVGARAPALVLHTLGGGPMDLGQPTGQVVVVNLWATWCAPCRAEMPMLNAFHLQHRSAGLTVVGVSADRSREKDDVRRVMSAFAYPAGLLSEAGGDFEPPRVLPMTYVIDRAGVVRAVFDGPVTAEKLAAAVQPLL